jgi:tetratricopeptide (TPR) repeat protein
METRMRRERNEGNMKALAVLAAVLLVLCSAQGAERSVADGLTAAGVAYVAKGNASQAKDLFYKALVHDENCPDALFELAKLIEKDGDNTLASDLYQRAIVQYTQDNKPANAGKRAEAEKRLRALNPAQPKLNAAYEEYAQDLDKVVKKLPDTLTEASALERINDLKLSTLVAADKMPKFYTAAAEKKAVPSNTNNNAGSDNNRDRYGRRTENPKNGSTSQEVQNELRALGWTTITGSWVKKSANTYEATDAKLEAQKTDGSIDFWILRDSGNGTVKATVRTEKNDFFGMGPGEQDMPGYGILYRGKDFRDYGFNERGGGGRRGPGGQGGQGFGRNAPSLEKTHPLSEAAKNHFIVKAQDTSLDFYHNDSRTYQVTTTKLPKAGNFVLDVNGTVVIEMPKVTGN